MKSFMRKLLGVVSLSLGFITAANAAVCTYSVSNNWGSGFQASISITNNAVTAINGWKVEWQYSQNKITRS